MIYLVFLLIISGCQNEVASNADIEGSEIPPVQEAFFIFVTTLNDTGVGEGQLTVKFGVLEESNRKMQLIYELTYLLDDTRLIYREDIYNDFLFPGNDKEFTIPITDLKEGKYMIELQASSEEKEGDLERWGMIRSIIFTVQNGKFSTEHVEDIR